MSSVNGRKVFHVVLVQSLIKFYKNIEINKDVPKNYVANNEKYRCVIL